MNMDLASQSFIFLDDMLCSHVGCTRQAEPGKKSCKPHLEAARLRKEKNKHKTDTSLAPALVSTPDDRKAETASMVVDSPTSPTSIPVIEEVEEVEEDPPVCPVPAVKEEEPEEPPPPAPALDLQERRQLLAERYRGTRNPLMPSGHVETMVQSYTNLCSKLKDQLWKGEEPSTQPPKYAQCPYLAVFRTADTNAKQKLEPFVLLAGKPEPLLPRLASHQSEFFIDPERGSDVSEEALRFGYEMAADLVQPDQVDTLGVGHWETNYRWGHLDDLTLAFLKVTELTGPRVSADTPLWSIPFVVFVQTELKGHPIALPASVYLYHWYLYRPSRDRELERMVPPLCTWAEDFLCRGLNPLPVPYARYKQLCLWNSMYTEISMRNWVFPPEFHEALAEQLSEAVEAYRSLPEVQPYFPAERMLEFERYAERLRGTPIPFPKPV